MITVITPSLPSRGAMLADAMRSVAHQTLRPAVHMIAVDYAGFGPAAVRNDLLEGVLTPWVAFLDDDDILDPDHLEVLATTVDLNTVDVVISHCRFNGDTIPDKYCNRPYDRDALREHGIFPITVLARRKAILAAGGFGGERYEDWSMFNRMADNGCRFHVIPRVTWTYRLGHGNRTHGTAA